MSFDTYNEELQSILSKLRSSLKCITDTPSSADLKMVHELLQQGDDIIKQMGLEARGADDADMKRELLEKVRYTILCNVILCVGLLYDFKTNASTKHNRYECTKQIYPNYEKNIILSRNVLKEAVLD